MQVGVTSSVTPVHKNILPSMAEGRHEPLVMHMLLCGLQVDSCRTASQTTPHSRMPW